MATSSSKVSPSKVHALITGPPGIGKTTLVRSVCQQLQQQGVGMHGFYTEEIRERGGGRGGKGPRIGFDVVSLDGQRSILARVARERTPAVGTFVGRYQVDVQSFEQVALPTLNRLSCVRSSSKVEARRELVVIDEIGKMELFSHQFVDAVQELFQSDKIVIMATVPVTRGKALPLVEELKQRKDCALFEVTESNRNALVDIMTKFIVQRIESYRH